jgi:hypothetical protein
VFSDAREMVRLQLVAEALPSKTSVHWFSCWWSNRSAPEPVPA